MAGGPLLSIDFGTSHTVSLVAWPDGRIRPLLFDGSPLLPSAVCAEPAGLGPAQGSAGVPSPLLVGRDAGHAARIDPARFESTPKRRIDDGMVLLGSEEYPVSVLITAVLSRVREEAVRVLACRPASVIMSHPATWGVSRRLTLMEAAAQAGLGEPVLVPEPVAAARYFAGLIGERFAPEHGVLVYDFGGGTFDASLVVRQPGGFDVRAVDGIDTLGGVDLDELIVEHARATLGSDHEEALRRLAAPATPENRRHHRSFWEDARMVKERLSRADTALLHVPLAGVDVPIARSVFEDLARPAIERTARTTAAVLRWSRLPKDHLVGIFLVGGSSRIPLVATVLERELGLAPTVLEQPEMVVSEGALRHGVGTPRPRTDQTPLPRPQRTPPRPPPQRPPPARALPQPALEQPRVMVQPVPAVPVSPPRPQQLEYRSANATRGSRRRWTVPVLAVLGVLSLAAVYLLLPGESNDPGASAQTQQSDRRSAPPESPRPSPSAAQPFYQRADRPAWLPAGWSLAVDGPASQLWRTMDEREGGRCAADGDVLHVTRPDAANLTGCTVRSPLDRIFYDVAVETQVTVTTGCGGMWARTGTRGYFLMICDGYARLSRLGETGADSTRLAEWSFGYRPQDATAGLLVVGNELRAYLSGEALGEPVHDEEIRYGKTTLGGDPGQAESIDVVFSGLRVFAPEP
ncbi:MAG: Hsp70 family protein [Dactylosporangium sp.]|nr:Hsp70 family protein [Dactylosporangium sp.]NNJ59892.1 Hsp70 family protein [Dactylosporangium sp.]